MPPVQLQMYSIGTSGSLPIYTHFLLTSKVLPYNTLCLKLHLTKINSLFYGKSFSFVVIDQYSYLIIIIYTRCLNLSLLPRIIRTMKLLTGEWQPDRHI